MPTLKKIPLLLALLWGLFGAAPLSATHIVGGEIQYECLGFNAATQVGTYRIILHVYRDCFNGQAGFDNQAAITIFQMGPSVSEWVTVNPSPIVTNIPPLTNNPCLIPPNNICVEEGLYEATVNLPYNPAGYTITYQRCCRNNTIDNVINPGQSGSTYSIFLSGQAQLTCNSSPEYSAFPPIVICNNQPLVFDHSATDAQGDQLVYSLCAPELGASQNNPQPQVADPPPYTPVTYLNPYNAGYPLGSNPPLSIDPITGLLTGTPTVLGQFVVGICVSEFRNGVLLSVTRRDFQFNVTGCTIAVDPTPRPDTSTTVNLGGGLQVVEGRSCDNTVFFQYTLPPGTNPALIQGQRWTFWNAALGFQVIDTTATITVQFPQPGLYNARIVVNPGIEGCTDSTDFQVRIYPPRVADFTFAIDSCNAQAPLVMTNTSQAFGAGNFIAQYAWNFGLGQAASALANPTWLPNNAGSYNIRLRITDANGCTAVRVVPTDWFPAANVQFAANDPDGCVAHATGFANTSFPYTAAYVTQWDFGNGATFTGQTPGTINYPTPGQYTVSATVTSPWGCVSDLVRPQHIVVYGQPTADFDIGYDTCELGPVAFADQSQPYAGQPLDAWNWSFGDGLTDTLSSPLHQYDSVQAGSFPIRLVVTDSFGCRDTAQRVLDWFPGPLVQVQVSDPNGCVPHTVAFANTSFPINGYTAQWDFGDGGTSAQVSPTHTYGQAGVYPVRLVITSPNGVCADSFQTVISVFDPPSAAFEVALDTCAIAPIVFSDQSTTNPTGDALVSWSWQFGDGATDLSPNTAHQYGNSGFYDIALVVTDANGCTDTAVATVPYFPEPTLAVNILGDNGCFGDTVFFDNVSFPNTGYITTWTFGDGGSSGISSPTHVYAAPGTYTVVLDVAAPVGNCFATYTDTVVVHENPSAAFAYFVDSCNLVPVVFTDQSGPNAAGDPLLSWSWDFDDGTDTTVFSPAVFSHLPTNSGTFDVLLTVTDANGCRDTAVSRVDWYPEPVVDVDILGQRGCLGQTVFFQNNSYPINGYTTAWNLGDGTTSLAPSPSHVYAAPGIYYVSLSITSPNGFCQKTYSDTVVVNGLPDAAFSFGFSPCVLGPVPFSDLSVPNAAPIPNPIVTWYWTFGDGNDTLFQSPVYPYQNPGSYTVELFVTDAAGCRDSVEQSLDWYPATPFAVVTDDPEGCVPHTASFSFDTYGVDVSAYNKDWVFGDGTTFNGAVPPPHLYTAPGTYVVALTLTAPISNCTQTALDTVYVWNLPEPDFAYSYDSCALGGVSFADLSVSQDGTPVGWQWNFGDGGADTLQNPVHAYDTIGNYTASLVVTDDNGCVDSLSLPVAYQPRPIYPVVLRDTQGCTPFTLLFDDNLYPLADYTTTWDFGDGSGSTDATPLPHVYADSGAYPVTLVVESTLGCVDTFSQLATALPLPVADFTYLPANPTSLAPTVTFIDQSTDAVLWDWDFGAGIGSNLPDPVYSFADTGLVPVQLIVTHANGCTDTTERILDIQPRYTYFLPNAFTPNGDGINDGYRGDGITQYLRSFRFTIWNRWGELVFQSDDPMEAWNGRKHNNGELCPGGVYVVLVEITGPRGEYEELKGYATLVY